MLLIPVRTIMEPGWTLTTRELRLALTTVRLWWPSCQIFQGTSSRIGCTIQPPLTLPCIVRCRFYTSELVWALLDFTPERAVLSVEYGYGTSNWQIQEYSAVLKDVADAIRPRGKLL